MPRPRVRSPRDLPSETLRCCANEVSLSRPERYTWLTLLVEQEQWRSCRQRRMPTPPLLWRARTQRVERSEKKSLKQILSSKASRSLILGIGPPAKCAFLVYKCLGRRG